LDFPRRRPHVGGHIPQSQSGITNPQRAAAALVTVATDMHRFFPDGPDPSARRAEDLHMFARTLRVSQALMISAFMM
jgi:hypothetical protein